MYSGVPCLTPLTCGSGGGGGGMGGGGGGMGGGRKEGFFNVVTDNRQPSQPTNCTRSTSAFAL
jgi:hypothetical protein